MKLQVYFRLFTVITLVQVLGIQLGFSKGKQAAADEVQFARAKVKIGKYIVNVEVAETDTQVARGLMYRHKKLTDQQGMLFKFEREKIQSFWMKNTFIPLSIGFFDKDRRLVHFTNMQPVKSEMEKPNSYSSKYPAKYVIELAPDWFTRHNIQLGTVFSYR